MEERQENSKEKEPELIPLEEDLDKIYHDHTEKSFKTEIRRKNETRFKLLQSLFLAMAFMILGWSKGQLGPAFMDLLFITGADLKAGSGFMTSYYAGRMLGSILAGVIYLKVNKYLIFVFSISINGIIVAAIPWCSQYELMMAAHVIHGVSGGVLDVAITSEAVKIWGPTARGRSYLQILAASFAVSGLLAPMATAPFLLQTKDNVNTYDFLNTSSAVTPNHEMSTGIYQDYENHSQVNQWSNNTNKQQSQIYIAFSISAGLAFLVVIPFIVLFLRSGPDGERQRRKRDIDFIGNVPIIFKRLQIINIGMFSAAFTGVDFTFAGYLTVFCVQYSNWTKTTAAMLTSVVFCSTLVWRLGGVFVVQKFKSQTLLFCGSMILPLSFVAMYVSARAQFNAGMWLSVVLLGIPFGILWPVFLSWVNENLIPVSGKVVAYLLVTSFSGAMVTPILIGYLMENESLLWFCYLCFILSVNVIINIIFMIIYTRCVNSSKYGHNDPPKVSKIKRFHK